MKETSAIPENFGPPSQRVSCEEGYMSFSVNNVVYFTESYVVERGIRVTWKTFEAIYDDKRSSYPYSQSNLVDVMNSFSKGTKYTRPELKLPCVRKGENGPYPEVIAFDLAKMEYPVDKYDPYVLELFPVDLPFDKRREMTPEQGHMFVMSHRRDESVIEAEAADLGEEQQKLKQMLTWLQPASKPEYATMRVPKFACIGILKRAKPIGSYVVDASSLFTSATGPLPETLPKNYTEYSVNWLKAKYPEGAPVPPSTPAPVVGSGYALPNHGVPVTTVIIPADPIPNIKHERPPLAGDTPEPAAKRVKLDGDPMDTS